MHMILGNSLKVVRVTLVVISGNPASAKKHFVGVVGNAPIQRLTAA